MKRNSQVAQGKQHSGNKQGFAQDRELASEAGKKGGQHSQGGGSQGGSPQQDQGSGKGNAGNFAQDRQKASEAGKKGGHR
jgi:hypothetical protein